MGGDGAASGGAAARNAGLGGAVLTALPASPAEVSKSADQGTAGGAAAKTGGGRKSA